MTSEFSSDKFYWHKYDKFYRKHFPRDVKGTIVEFGVFNGDSIRWLFDTYPNAQIIGVDILQPQPDWPQSDRIIYKQLDQDNIESLKELFNDLNDIELIIEDGSHLPTHQSNCLKFGLRALRIGGLYVLEDIHTSHPEHVLFRRDINIRNNQTSLTVLLAIENLISKNSNFNEEILIDLADGLHFQIDDIDYFLKNIEKVFFYRRSTLPLRCWKCTGDKFKYLQLKCECGEELYLQADSMAAIIKKI